MSATPIDPRLRDRRIEVARDHGRRRLRRVLVGLGVVAILVGAVAATRSPLLDVDRIEVEGTTRTDPSAVVEASGLALGDPMASLDLGAAASRLESLPWIADATVVRTWPSTVRISVEERMPVAVADGPGGPVLVDGDGRVVAEGSLEGLPSLDVRAPAPGEQVPAAARTAIAVVAGLPSDLRREVAVAASTDRGVELELHDEIVVEWGDRTQSAAKAEALRVILAEAGRATIATIDVTVPRATTLTRDDGGR